MLLPGAVFIAAFAVVAAVAFVMVIVFFPSIVALSLSRNPKIDDSCVPVFSREECARLAGEVYAMRDLWHRKSIGGEMHTLGKASYLGGEGVSNEDMDAKFAWVYGRLSEVFREQYPATEIVIGGGDIAPRAGTPGFHIFTPMLTTKFPYASLHMDRQFLNAGFCAREDADKADTLSFTILITEPEGGAGLHIWDASSVPSAAKKYVAGAPLEFAFRLGVECRDVHRYVPYRIGCMATHSGHHYHAIAPFAREAVTPRITLQGHGYFTENREKLYLYW